ncbi:uncharacterized, partial [Tachysurus ichikawai]
PSSEPLTDPMCQSCKENDCAPSLMACLGERHSDLQSPRTNTQLIVEAQQGCPCLLRRSPFDCTWPLIFRTLSEQNAAQWAKRERKLTTNYAAVNERRGVEGVQHGSALALI